MTRVRTFRDLAVWQVSMDLVVCCYATTRAFAKTELYGLVSQVRRAALWVPSNIAEGNARLLPGEYAHFLRIAHASLNEPEILLLIATRVGLLTEQDQEQPMRLLQRCSALLLGLHRSIRKRHESPTCRSAVPQSPVP